ncbi:SGS domain-containing protein, putative [Eimeria maxima]|uniref:SGS domain-containing protein, putative n=1 Tax=Eimeria maxima TaxID=5804 RepID=U6M882_EIMMA|nr:SGS domain-containing protein, putative [Eimeria maxima]CDJ58664.1 SGS domain-containing protein, putative [Eimeria maxima]
MSDPAVTTTMQQQAGDSNATEAPASPFNPRYEWMQNAEKLFITFFVKSLEDSDVTVDISSQSLKVQIRNPSINKEAAEDQQQIFVFHVPKLRHEIRPEDSTYEIHKAKLEILLSKKNTGETWAALEAVKHEQGQQQQQQPAVSASRVYPSSKKKIDWNKMEKQTSGGTVLSTNWADVKDKDYEKNLEAPEGQEVRSWKS